MEGSTTALFYRLNTLIRLVTDQLLGYRLCHLSKSWESRKKIFFVVLAVVVKSKHKAVQVQLSWLQGRRLSFRGSLPQDQAWFDWQ